MDPIAFSIFGVDVAWYGILIALAMFVGTMLGIKEANRVGLGEDTLLDFLIIALPLSIIGARMYYVIFEWDRYRGSFKEILNIRNGGLAIHGGVITAIIVAIVFTKVKKIDFWVLADIAAPSLVLGQSIGRWGNYINQEAHGGPTDLPWGIMVEGVKVHPTFLYESIWNIGIFIFLIWYRKNHQKIPGELFLLYLALYSFIRVLIEGLRTDSLMLGNIRIAQLVSIMGIFIGVALFIYKRKKQL